MLHRNAIHAVETRIKYQGKGENVFLEGRSWLSSLLEKSRGFTQSVIRKTTSRGKHIDDELNHSTTAFWRWSGGIGDLSVTTRIQAFHGEASMIC